MWTVVFCAWSRETLMQQGFAPMCVKAETYLCAGHSAETLNHGGLQPAMLFEKRTKIILLLWKTV
ncbi:hypothetical protein [Flavisolibacter nicotianae]|uniref:hypothetical protein n=1 Tax=Flavisolibacter nicotianae TaxID=2364882 RepID=UPI000EB0E73D|nr:hypothetical protein [Flavisolibacter nicotianae]